MRIQKTSTYGEGKLTWHLLASPRLAAHLSPLTARHQHRIVINCTSGWVEKRREKKKKKKKKKAEQNRTEELKKQPRLELELEIHG